MGQRFSFIQERHKNKKNTDFFDCAIAKIRKMWLNRVCFETERTKVIEMYERDLEENALLRKSAGEIASAVSALIGFDVVITDASGAVAGASSSRWQDMTLTGAKEAVATARTVEIERNGSGAFYGVISPIQSMNGRVGGAAAIFGEPSRVRAFGGIVGRQVELLLRERELYAFAGNRESTLENLVQDIGSFVPGVSNEAMLASRAAEFGYDRSRDYTAVAVDLYQFGRFAVQAREAIRDGETPQARILTVRKAVLAGIRKVFCEDGDISATLGNNRFVVLHVSGENGPQQERTLQLASRALEAIDAFGLKAAVGVGSPARGIPALAVSYQEAWKALFLGKKFCARPGVYDIAAYRLEDIVTTIDPPARARYVRAVTGSFRSSPDWEQMRETIRGWCESSFSLVEAAARLHIHRNTLIYRIEKIARETGLNLKDFRTCLNLYLALVMDQYTGPAVKE